MFRSLTLLFVSAMLASAFVLYSVNYKTRALEHELRDAGRALDATAREVATLRAEREFLARPARLAAEAKALGMRPAEGAQFVVEQSAGSVASDRGDAVSQRSRTRAAWRAGSSADANR